MGPDDLREGGIFRGQPVGMWLREGTVSQLLGRGSRGFVRFSHPIARLVHWTRAAEARSL
jgi:hypothetical protein